MKPHPQTGERVEIAIESVAHGGDGVGRVSGQACFVPGAFPGDVVCARITRRGKRILWAQITDILSPSEHRLSLPGCENRPCASACGWQAFSYPAQGQWKQRIVQETLRRIGGVDIEVLCVEDPALRLGYRTRATFHGDGVQLGYYAPRSHHVVCIEGCPLNHPRLNEALTQLQPLGIQGDVRVTVNPDGNDTLIWLPVMRHDVNSRFPLANSREDRERHQFIFDGAPIVNGAFCQSSLLLNRMLRAYTEECIGAPKRLLDLYCGNGNLSLNFCKSCHVHGVDHAGPAVTAAAVTSPGIYEQGDECTMAALLLEEAWDVVLLDPPRVGAGAITDALGITNAHRIVYVSCNPATLARDTLGLRRQGWRMISAAMLDMFPHTPHMESVCVFER